MKYDMSVRLLIAIIAVLTLPGAALAHYEGELLPDSVAVMEYSMVISMTPKDTVTRNKLGMVYLRQNRLDQARKQFMDILRIEPRNFDALDSLGLVSDREGKYAEAAQWYKKAMKERPEDVGVRMRYEGACSKLKEVKK